MGSPVKQTSEYLADETSRDSLRGLLELDALQTLTGPLPSDSLPKRECQA